MQGDKKKLLNLMVVQYIKSEINIVQETVPGSDLSSKIQYPQDSFRNAGGLSYFTTKKIF